MIKIGIDMLLHHCFIKTAKRYANKTALIDRTTGKVLSYSKTLIATLILSSKLRLIEKGFIGIMIPNSAGSVIAVLATLMSGHVPVMINYSTGAETNVRYAQKKCRFRTVITSKALLQKINCPVIDGMIFIEDIMAEITIKEKLKALLFSKLPASLICMLTHSGNKDDNAFVLLTSGSEKEPKAVVLTHRNILSNIESFSQVIHLKHEDRMLANLPFFHVFGLTVNMWTPLYHGMTSVLYANPLDYKKICDIVREEKVTVMAGTPSFLQGYLRKSEKGDFNSLRIVVSGADRCPESLMSGFLEKHNIKLIEGYGTTETSPVISANTPEHYRPGSVGKPLPGVQVRIENLQTGEECRPGEAGRIMVKGDLVMKEYLYDLEETAMRIRQGWYDTGDIGYLDHDGFLWHSGRLKRFVKIGGEMISLVMIENELEGILKEDASCCVVEIPDDVKGSRIVAAVEKEIDEKDVLRRLSERIPNIALPKQFVVIPELPKMGSGKIDFRKVTKLVLEKIASNKMQ